MNIKIENTNLAEDIKQEVENQLAGGYLPAVHALRPFKVYMVAITRYLATVKNTKAPVAFTVTDAEGKFYVGAVVEYNDTSSEEDGTTGNWNYYWTFDENDIPKEATVYDIKNKQTHQIIVKSSLSDCNAQFAGVDSLIKTASVIFGSLIKTLKDTAREDEVVELEYDGVFKCQAKVEDDEVVMSIIQDGLIKKMIKDDAALEEAKTA